MIQLEEKSLIDDTTFVSLQNDPKEDAGLAGLSHPVPHRGLPESGVVLDGLYGRSNEKRNQQIKGGAHQVRFLELKVKQNNRETLPKLVKVLVASPLPNGQFSEEEILVTEARYRELCVNIHKPNNKNLDACFESGSEQERQMGSLFSWKNKTMGKDEPAAKDF